MFSRIFCCLMYFSCVIGFSNFMDSPFYCSMHSPSSNAGMLSICLLWSTRDAAANFAGLMEDYWIILQVSNETHLLSSQHKAGRKFYTITNCLMHSIDNLLAGEVNQSCVFDGKSSAAMIVTLTMIKTEEYVCHVHLFYSLSAVNMIPKLITRQS